MTIKIYPNPAHRFNIYFYLEVEQRPVVGDVLATTSAPVHLTEGHLSAFITNIENEDGQFVYRADMIKPN